MNPKQTLIDLADRSLSAARTRPSAMVEAAIYETGAAIVEQLIEMNKHLAELANPIAVVKDDGIVKP